MFNSSTYYEMMMESQRTVDLLTFERALRCGFVEHGSLYDAGLRRRAAAVLVTLASWLDRAAVSRTGAPAVTSAR